MYLSRSGNSTVFCFEPLLWTLSSSCFFMAMIATNLSRVLITYQHSWIHDFPVSLANIEDEQCLQSPAPEKMEKLKNIEDERIDAPFEDRGIFFSRSVDLSWKHSKLIGYVDVYNMYTSILAALDFFRTCLVFFQQSFVIRISWFASCSTWHICLQFLSVSYIFLGFRTTRLSSFLFVQYITHKQAANCFVSWTQ